MSTNRKPSAPASIVARMFVRELEDGQAVDQVLLVRELEVRRKRDGCEYFKLVLGDRTGIVPAVVWEPPAELNGNAAVGRPLHVSGRYAVHQRYGPQLTVREVRAPGPQEVVLEELLDGPSHGLDKLEQGLRDLVATVQNPHLRTLLVRVLGEASEVWPRFRVAPAAKYYHQAYPHGLLEHGLSVAEGASAISATFPGIDRDVAADLQCGDRTALGHQVGDQRKLPDQLLGVLGHER